MTATDIDLIAGEPFARTIRVTDAALVWPDIGSVEVRAQARSGPSERYPLVADLADYLDLAIDGSDVVITLAFTGQDTRTLKVHGSYYDMFLSDPGPDDGRAVRIQYGRIHAQPNVTAGE